jgi:hypothetical protein
LAVHTGARDLTHDEPKSSDSVAKAEFRLSFMLYLQKEKEQEKEKEGKTRLHQTMRQYPPK